MSFGFLFKCQLLRFFLSFITRCKHLSEKKNDHIWNVCMYLCMCVMTTWCFVFFFLLGRHRERIKKKLIFLSLATSCVIFTKTRSDTNSFRCRYRLRIFIKVINMVSSQVFSSLTEVWSCRLSGNKSMA